MDDEQLRNIAQLLVKSVIEKAVDKINTEKREMYEGLDQGVDDIVELTIGRSINAIREGQSSPTDDKMEGLAGPSKTLATATPEVNTGTTVSKALEIKDGRIEPSVGENDDQPHIITVKGTKKRKVTTTYAQMSKASHKKNVLGRLLDRIIKRDKKESKEIDAATAGENSIRSCRVCHAI
ncbi:hypothetical protein KP79_PYT09483 [Mizuhopecten yessoensis]|uniref:Uncharacterized protein n=1 Tax=Mizuhopecten yessoensis TaxID=6573 RepID=A0A210QNS6_MIZYE|nr:hypothetical protein KP79_PYT09483 [Mizuhopecten yessoensis]